MVSSQSQLAPLPTRPLAKTHPTSLVNSPTFKVNSTGLQTGPTDLNNMTVSILFLAHQILDDGRWTKSSHHMQPCL